MSISFLLDQNPNVALVGLDGAGGRTRAKGSLGRRSVELRANGTVACIDRRYSAVIRAEPGYCEHCARARSFHVGGVRRRGHGRWGVVSGA